MAVSIHLQSHRGLDTKVLDVAHIPSPHNSESIKTKYQEILAAHGLDPTDTFKVVSDNASNMKKAFKVCLWDEKDTEGDDRVEEDENEEEDDADDVNDVEVDFEEVFQEQYRRRCNIHTLQLLVNDCIKLLPVRYQNILKKSKIVCAKQHRSNKLSEAMSVQLPEGCATRWNGQLALMKVIEAHFLEVQQNV